jgi:CRISPR type IV-associated protein Csf3
MIFKIDGLKSNLYLQYVVSQNNFQDKFVIGWNDLMYYKLVGVNGIGLQTATGFGIQ